MKRLFACVLPAAIMLTAGNASAASCTASAVGVAFGAYDRLSLTPRDSTGTVTVRCTTAANEPVNYSIQLSTGSSGLYSVRHMTNGANILNYNLYTNNTRTTIWGSGTAGTSAVNASFPKQRSASTRSRKHTTYGRILAGQIVLSGSYSDTITVTVTY
jgi:spore coat protein U-like protein